MGRGHRCRVRARLLGIRHAGLSRHEARQGIDIAHGSTPAGYEDTGGSYRLHFPDGNATIARLLVRDLIPSRAGASAGNSAEEIVTARVDYSQLDRAGTPLRLRLSSTVDPRAPSGGSRSRHDACEVTYMRAGGAYHGAGPRRGARVLQHDDSLSLPGAAGGAEGRPCTAW